MDSFDALGALGDQTLIIGLSSTRIAVAFLLVPLFTAQLIPTMVRNAIFLSLALLNLALIPAAEPPVVGTGQLIALFAKEIFIGGALGFLFASMMWAFEAAGQLIDAKVGTTQAQIQDPLSGHQTTLFGALFGRLASFIFMAGGGLMIMTGTLLDSFTFWPVGAPWPELTGGGARVFEVEFGRIMRIMLLIAAPTLVLLYMVEGVLGLINRFAPQLNVFSLSLSLKAVAACSMVLLQLTMIVHLLQDDLIGRGTVVLGHLRSLLGS